MELDLVTKRNIQLFMRLAELPERPISPCLCWQRPEHETYLTYQDGRIHLSQFFPRTIFDDRLLRQGLSDWQPTRFSGIPQRLFHLRQGLAISCSPPPDSSAELWLSLHRRQIAFMEALCIAA